MGVDKPVPITVETTVQVPVEQAREYWMAAEPITKWCFANDGWHGSDRWKFRI